MDNEQTDKKLEYQDLFYLKVLSFFTEIIGSDLDFKNKFENQEDLHKFESAIEYSISLILQIVIKCCAEHSFKFRIFAVNNVLIEKIAKLTRMKSKLINLWIIKFFKTIIRCKDDLYI